LDTLSRGGDLKISQNSLMDAIKDGYEGKDVGQDSQQWSFSGAFYSGKIIISFSLSTIINWTCFSITV